MSGKSTLLLLMMLFAGMVEVCAQQIKFVPNRGQFEDGILYKANIPAGTFFVQANCLTYLLHDGTAFAKYHDTHDTNIVVQFHAYKVWLEGASLTPGVIETGTTPEYYNYFKGNDPKHWATGVYGTYKVTLTGVYPKIDLEILSTPQKNLKYNFIVHPGGNPASIRLRYEGAGAVSLKNGELHVQTVLGEMKEEAPLTNQQENTIGSRYVLHENQLTFAIDNYNKSKDLIIDPKVIFSTYSGSFADNWGFTGTYDNKGNGYSGGTVYDIGFPASVGAFQRFFKGGVDVNSSVGELARDAAILKYTSDGKSLIFATYLGGTHNEQPQSMVVNSNEELLILGSTMSSNFPMLGTGYDKTYNGDYDIYVVKFSADGKSLLSSSYIGGNKRDGQNGNIESGFPASSPLAYNYGDIYRGEINVDKNDNVYFTSSTESRPVHGFPVINAFQILWGGGTQEGCVFKMSKDLDTIYWSSYIGGNGYDAGYALCIDSKNHVFVTGGTEAGLSFGMNGAVKAVPGGIDGYVISLNATTGAYVGGSYIGTSDYNQSFFVQTDSAGNVFVAGQNEGAFPVFPTGIYNDANSGQFIQEFTNNLGTLLKSTVFGNKTGKPNISLSAFMVDKCNHVFVSGWGGEVNSPFEGGHGGTTYNMVTTSDAFQKTTDGSDFYVAVFSKNLSTMLFSTYYGGNNVREHVDGGTSRFDKEGIIYQSVCGGCGGSDAFPTTAGAWSRTNNSSNCNNALFKIDFENLNRSPDVEDTSYTVNYFDTLSFTYRSYDPDFDDSLYTSFSQATSLTGKVAKAISGNQVTAGIGSYYSTFRYTANCDTKNDSFYIKVKLRDVGCPGNKSDTAIIKIKFLPPTVPEPPKQMCMTFINSHTVRIQWDSFQTDKYFKYYLLYRTVNGITKVVDTIRNTAIKQFYDSTAFNYETQNYCYHLTGYNVCNEPGTQGYDACSIREFNIPIDSTYMYTATVEDNRNIRIAWLRSTEKDFFSYQIYRKKTNTSKPENFVYYKSIFNVNDTTFLDSNVDVANIQYCYNIKVTDYCGHISHFTNKACNIIINGHAKPFEHTLTWLEYNDWLNGVKNYDLFRFDDRSIVSNIVTTPYSQRSHIDVSLDYDWGGYWYYTVARQNDALQATSRSNTIYLFQPPLVWVPNAFSSNGDHINDTWGVVPVFVKEYKMRVYNRWGQLVFESDDKHKDWDGTFNGRTAFDEVLVWIVTYTGWDDNVYYKHGTLTILN